MAYEDSARPMAHSLTLDERAKLTVTGVEEVESFDEERIELRTVKGRLHQRRRAAHRPAEPGDRRAERGGRAQRAAI